MLAGFRMVFPGCSKYRLFLVFGILYPGKEHLLARDVVGVSHHVFALFKLFETSLAMHEVVLGSTVRYFFDLLPVTVGVFCMDGFISLNL